MTSDPDAVGDEALLLARRTGRPVMVGRDRPAAARALLAAAPVDLVISDDGLQHYALGRDVEIAVVDAQRRHGNGRCLPAGPLREPVERLEAVDLVVGNGAALTPGGAFFRLEPAALQPLAELTDPPAPPAPGSRVHAVAGIGHPQRFFATLTRLGYQPERHALGDHHRFRAADLHFADDRPVIVTEKDAVKCQALAPANSWFLPVMAQPDPATAERLRALLGMAKTRFAKRSLRP